MNVTLCPLVKIKCGVKRNKLTCLSYAAAWCTKTYTVNQGLARIMIIANDNESNHKDRDLKEN